MIYRNGKLVQEIDQVLLDLVNKVQKLTARNIGAIYKGSQLVFLTVLNAIKSCYGSGTWIQDKPWLDDDYWKNN